MFNHKRHLDIEILQKGDWGQIQRCRNCRFVQVEYGNLIRSFNEEEFVEVFRLTTLHLPELVTFSPTNQRPIIFRFPDVDGYYCFNEIEWIQFNQLLQQTKETVEVDLFLLKNGFLTQ